LNNNYLKVFNEQPCSKENNFILKIYGIWETEYEYGVTYKFITV